MHKIVLTGGPCAGKTTCLARVSAYLMERGFNVFTVPEAATLLFTNGAKQFDETTTDEQVRVHAPWVVQLWVGMPSRS